MKHPLVAMACQFDEIQEEIKKYPACIELRRRKEEILQEIKQAVDVQLSSVVYHNKVHKTEDCKCELCTCSSLMRC